MKGDKSVCKFRFKDFTYKIIIYVINNHCSNHCYSKRNSFLEGFCEMTESMKRPDNNERRYISKDDILILSK